VQRLRSFGPNDGFGDDLLAAAEAFTPERLVPQAEPEDVCVLIYTGGTTGRPKGVAHTHRVHVTMILTEMADWDGPSEIRFLALTPITHASGAMIMPVLLKSRKGDVTYATDEHFRPNCGVEELARLKPVFLKENGTVTAGNASGINDAAAAVVLMDAATAKARGLTSMGRLVSYAHTGLDPKIMGMGPVSASRLAMQKAGLQASDMDVIEANEAFAAQACAVTQELGLDPAKVNPNGSGISLGHPIGATGALITVKALYELKRIGGRYALVTMCIGGGQGIAAIFER